MNRRFIWPVVIAFLCIQASAYAASGSKVFDAYQAKEKKMEKAVNTMILSQQMEGHGMKAETTVYKKGKKIRMESLIKASSNPMMGKAGQKTVIIDDGQTMWTFSPMMGKMSAPSASDEEYESQPTRVVEKGREKVSGMDCIKLDVSYPDENKTLWISTKDSVLVKEESRDEDRMTTVYSDFKTIKGYPLAHKIETYEDGQQAEIVRITSVKINGRVDDSMFDPNRVKGFDQKKGPGMAGKGPKGNNMDAGMNMMQMALEIQRLYQNGEVEKAQALEKKMQKMMQ